MRTKKLLVRIDAKDLKSMKKIFKSQRGESKAAYFKRWVAELKRMGLKGVAYK